MARRAEIGQGISDDTTIAQGLLTKTNIPRRRTSLGGISIGSNRLESLNRPTEVSWSNAEGQPRRVIGSSNTWTSSCGDVLSDHDDIEDRTPFVQEYNRIARKHGIRLLIPDEYETPNAGYSLNTSGKSGGWFSRKILRRTSSSQSGKLRNERHIRHRRSISDLSMRLKSKKDTLKDKDLQELVRLCGSSLLYLPSEYAAGSLSVPTCFRATAQYLVQHASTARGVFRVPGSHNIIGSLYNHYCTMDEDGAVVAGTVRCPTLPDHIKCDVHDVASAFKKFLSGLPGGILGSLAPFDALVSIQSQLHSDPELTRTKHSKVRARLIALVIAELKSQYRRELICAVFGLLCMIGRAAETARREDDRGRPLPISDLMGYGPLGIVFGPLLVGDLLESYTMRLANPHGGLVLLPVSPPRSRKEKNKKSRSIEDADSFNTHVDKMRIANGITEMLITHWRDVVRHMKNLGALRILGECKSLAVPGSKPPFLRPSASESFALRRPPDWDNGKAPIRRMDRSVSPTPAHRGRVPGETQSGESLTEQPNGTLIVRKQRSKVRPMSSQMLSGARSMSVLSPTVEEHSVETDFETDIKAPWHKKPPTALPSLVRPASRLSIAQTISGKTDESSVNAKNLAPESLKAEEKGQYSNRESKGEQLREHHNAKLSEWKRALTALNVDNAPSPIPDGIVSNRVRQITSSDPGVHIVAKLGSSPPTVNYPLSETTRLEKTGSASLQRGSTNDPLARISQEEDMASLEALARALGESTEAEIRLNKAKKHDFEVGIHPRPGPEHHLRTSRTHEVEGYPSIDVPHVSFLPETKPILSHETQNLQIDASSSQNSCHTVIASSSKTKQSGAVTNPLSHTPTGNVKALAARFNNAESPSPTVHSSIKSSTKSLIAVTGTHVKLAQETLVAPYTTNPPSPARSQISTKSEKSLQSTHKQLPTDRQLIAQGSKPTLEPPTPRRLARLSPKSSTPLLPNCKILEETSGLGNISPPRPSCPNSTPLKNVRIPAPMQVPTNLNAFDGPFGSLSLGTRLPLPDPPPVAHQVHRPQSSGSDHATPDFVNSQWAFADVNDMSKPISPVPNLLPNRSNSVLHTQIRTLQRQLYSKTEEVRQLKQQLEARDNLDIGTLSEQLRETKRELQMYKSRAEFAEKQLEMQAKLPIRSSSCEQSRNSLSTVPQDQRGQASTEYSEDGTIVADRIRRTLHGMDGAASWQGERSGESSNTVIRHVREAISGSEYGIWMAQTMTALDFMGPYEME